MSAIDRFFEELRASGRKAFMPFVTAGDPDLDFTAEVVGLLARRGASLFEIGLPYSDPIADGPVIQASYTRALDRHVTLGDILGMISRLRSEVKAPLVAMGSFATVWRHGLEVFVEREVLGRSWRGSMLAECVNSLLRPILDRRKHTDQGCLELFRFLHNMRPFRRGKRAHHSPAQLVGLDVPDDPLILLGLAPKVSI